MTNIRIVTGEYASVPYYLNSVCMNVYCAEELCYLLALNPFLITQDLMNQDLVNWFERECKLSDLAGELRLLFNRGSQLIDFVNTIMNYVGFCDEVELKLIDDTLRNNAGLTDYERKKQQADYLLKNGRYEAAIEEYESLLGVLPDVESKLKPLVYNNIGFSYARLFMFEVAAKYYKRGYDMTHLMDMAVQYLAALRMAFSEDKYLRYISEHPEYHDASLELEKKVNRLIEDFEGSRESIMLNALDIYKDEGNVASYYDEIDKVIYEMKQDYLKQVLD